MASTRKSKPIKPNAGTVIVDPDKPKPRKGEMAAQVRRLKTRYPEMTAYAIAKRVGCSENSARGVLRTFLGTHTEDTLRQYQAAKADVCDSIAMRCLENVTDEKLAKTPAVSLITGAAIMIDKSQLLSGQPTSINMTAFVDVLEAIKAQQG